jgi:hypothetical protein
MTRHTRLRIRATVILAGLAILAVAALRTEGPVASTTTTPDDGDVAAYQELIGRLRTGTPYYAAVGSVLRTRHYASREIFNWRTPAFFLALAALPDRAMHGLVVVLGIALSLLTFATGRTDGPIVRWVTVLAQLGILILLVTPRATVMSELWIGILLALSLCAYRLQRWGLAVVVAVLALFLRELAAPYCVACALLAISHRHWREVAAWTVGACLYAIYYAIHVVRVAQYRLPTDPGHSSSWLEVGGLHSLLDKVHFSYWLIMTPWPLTVLALLLIVAGILNMRTPPDVRWSAVSFILFFLLAGKDFDTYWGLVAWPVWAVCCGHGAQHIVLLASDAGRAHPPAYNQLAETA